MKGSFLVGKARAILIVIIMTLLVLSGVLALRNLPSVQLKPSESPEAVQAQIRAQAETERPVYSLGERVNITIEVHNLTNITLSLTFGVSLQAAYIVDDSDNSEVYNLWGHVAVLAVLTYLELEPGQHHQYNFTDHAWWQVDDRGSQVAPGIYTIVPSLSLYSDVTVELAPATVDVRAP